MKNENYTNPYRNLGFDKIDAPKKGERKAPVATKTVGTDLRVGGKKK